MPAAASPPAGRPRSARAPPSPRHVSPREAPAPLGIDGPGERVGDGVEVGRDRAGRAATVSSPVLTMAVTSAGDDDLHGRAGSRAAPTPPHSTVIIEASAQAAHGRARQGCRRIRSQRERCHAGLGRRRSSAARSVVVGSGRAVEVGGQRGRRRAGRQQRGVAGDLGDRPRRALATTGSRGLHRVEQREAEALVERGVGEDAAWRSSHARVGARRPVR